MQPLEIFAGAPAGFETCLRDPTIALAAAQAGAVGLLDCEFAPLAVTAAALRQVQGRSTRGTFALKLSVAEWPAVAALAELEALLHSDRLGWVVLSLGGLGTAPDAAAALGDVVTAARARRLRVLVEVTSSAEAALGSAVAADGLVAKGHEAEGRVGEETSFVLLQRLVKERAEPIYVHGGVGLHTAAACLVGGARGVVITSPLLLARESPLSDSILARLGRLDGTEPQCHALPQTPPGERYRLYTRPGSPAQASLQHFLRAPAAEGAAAGYQALCALLHQPSEQRAWLLGQDIAYAAALARRFGSTAAILQAVRDAAAEQLAEVAAAMPLAEGSPLSQAHATRYPIVQGAMTRVSDTAEFAWHVASTGALPFLAVALLRNAELETLLAQTAARLGTLPWGVGILGFVPPELRQEQLAVVLRYKPPFALIAGGRPDQAQALEAQGIRTYLHVPSPLLLRSFVEQGARRFIFEGRECGGHVGPRSSFVLWEAMVAELLSAAESGQDLREVQLLLAGGICDARSAAMAVAITAPLLRLGVRVGVLMGTAYLFTEEAVRSGAVTEGFQREVLRCERTVLFETGPGHAIRCLDSPYRRTFDARRSELAAKQVSGDETRQELEMMNLGRLRIASKGVARVDGALTTLPVEQQWQDGMFMVGQVAGLRDQPLTMSALHAEIAAGGTALLAKLHPKEPAKPPIWSPPPPPSRPVEDIAIVGMSCLFPAANQLAAYWRNILNRVDTITEVPKSHWAWEKLYDPDPLARDKINSKWGGFLGDIPLDPRRYGIPPSSISSIDPMQLMLLEVTRAALADAGYTSRGFARGRTSVILANAGHGPITVLYSLRSMLGWLLSDLHDEQKEALATSLPEWTEDSFAGYLGNVAAGRISNRFDLGGVNFSIDAACASSLAALYLSVRELRDHTSDMVLLSAIDTHNQPGDYLSFAKTHALSPRGRCRTFDATADGIVISEGAAVLVLKRRRDAERDGDRIYALVRGVGGSSDGRDRSLTAPRPEGQLLALQRAYADAGVSPATVGLVEAHGTGTVAGDRAEVAALRMMWQHAGAGPQQCALGSVKTMIGHTKSAAGLASLIKVAKALHHKVLPPTMGVTTPSPACELERSPFYLCTEGRPWLQPTDAPRRAGISAFGFGGTNFHAVLEEYPSSQSTDAANQVTPDWPSELFLLSAANAGELLGRIAQLRAEVGAELQIDTSLVGPVEAEVPRRSLFQVAHAHYLRQLDRPAATGLVLGIVASSLQELHDKLDAAAARVKEPGPLQLKDPRGIYCFAEPLGRSRKVAFLFPGQGSQRVGMLGDLALYFPQVRQALERADQTLAGQLPRRLSSYFLPPPTFTDAERGEHKAALTDTRVAQAALGAADLAALGLLRSLGIDADLLAGHSYGEYVALYAAGVFTEASLLEVSAARGRLLAEPPDGASSTMAAVGAAAADVAPLLDALPGVTLANHNSPAQCVIGGATAAVDHAVATLTERGLVAKKIAVSAAFHSPLMAYAQTPLAAAVTAAVVAAPRHLVFGNLDAAPYPAQSEGIAARLAAHLVKPVLFEQTVRALYAAGAGLFVEVGPGSVLSKLVDATLPEVPHLALPLERAGKDGLTSLLHLLALLSASGVAVDQSPLYRHRRESYANQLGLPAVSSGSAAGAGAAKAQLLYAMNSARIERVGNKDGHPVRVPPSPQLPTAPAKMAAPFPGVTDQEIGGITPTMYTTSPNSVAPARAAPAAEGLPTPGVSAAAPSPAGPAAWPEPPASAPAWAPAPSGAEQVMLQFQQTMVQLASGFLETQQRVMLAYLESRPGSAVGSSTTSAPSAALFSPPPAFRPSVLPAPPMSTAVVGGQFPVPASAAPQSTYAPQLPAPQAAPTPHVAPVAPTPPVAPAPSPAAGPDLGAQLLQIVSERTGYPLEMLDPNLDLEADLGIDSIKRIEILNTFRKLLPKEQQQRLEKDVEKLAGSKTLKSILSFVQQGQTGAGGPPLSPKQAPVAPPESRRTAGAELAVIKPQELLRAVRCEVALPVLPRPPRGATPISRPLLLIGDRFADSAAVGDRLIEAGVPVLRAGMADEGTPTYPVDLDDEKDVLRLLHQLEKEHGGIGGLVYLVGLSPQLTDIASGGRFPVPLGRLMRLAKHLRPQLENGVVLCCSQPDRVDMELAERSAAASTAAELQAALGGAVRSLGREWPRARVRAVALTTELPEEQTAELLCAELLDPEARTEIIYRGTVRYGVQAEPRPLPAAESSAARLALGPQSVILITGGARGVTAAAAAELARRYQPTLILVGRSPLPSAEESAETAALHTTREIKAALLARLRSTGQPVAIPAIEAAYAALQREREVRSTLAKLTALGSRVFYHTVDVSDPVATTALVHELYATHGRIDGLIHGAGVIHDAPIHNKSLTSARRVYETKVLSARTLLHALQVEELTFCAFFSSIVAHTGNAAQVDYAAANAAMNQLALELDAQTPGRVVSLLWGPWRGGMVRLELEEILRGAGWELIEESAGAAACIDELQRGRKGEVEVLITAPMGEAAQARSSGGSAALAVRLAKIPLRHPRPGITELPLRLEVGVDHYLLDHSIDGVPVLPMASALSLIAEAAALAAPGWHLGRIEQLTLLSGVRLVDGSCELILRCTAKIHTELHRQLHVEVLGAQGRQRAHYRATVELYPSLAAVADSATALALPPRVTPAPPPLPVSELYGRWLFHGPLFQGITAIDGFSDLGVAGHLRASHPADCLVGAGPAEQWLVDPILLDSAMQLAGVWSRHFGGVTVLPMGCQTLVRFGAPKSPSCLGRVRIVPSEDASELRCDVAVFDLDGTPVLLMLGLFGVGSKALNRIAAGPAQRSLGS